MLFLIRHGETTWNAARRLQGQQDTPLNDKGRQQAREAALILANISPDVARTTGVMSPLSRARDTADIVVQTLIDAGRLAAPLPFRADKKLMELSFGAWEGLTWKEVRRTDPTAYAARNRDIWNVAPPAGESYDDLERRAGPLLAALPPGAVAVSHGGVSRIALRLFAGFEPERAARAEIRQGDVLMVTKGEARWASGAPLRQVD